MYSVLIVDDDRMGRQGIISMMPWEKYGMIVMGEAQNGEKALEFLAHTMVDLVFVDLDMPVIDGISLMQKCKELYPNLLYVVMTFHEDFHYVQSALRIGAIDYISKLQMESTDCDELLKRISQRVEDNMHKKSMGDNGHRESVSKSNSKEINIVHAFEEKEWQSIVKRWNEMFWIYDDVIFEELCTSTRGLDLSIWRVAQVLLQLTSRAEESISKVHKDIPEYKNLDDFFKWLTSFRDALHKASSNETNLDNMPLSIMKIVVFIEENLGSQLHAEEIASKINLSRSYFSINFKKYTGMAFKEFVRRERIRKAKTLLVMKDAPLADIALDIGYEDVSYFIRVFSELTGMTPGEYRKQHSRKYNK
ncbi:response regulator transcription factor [Clostridium lacusfryxellense]|uniref:response regulator transcription factor n=1 Tax=Clostridium lacusfryxellense TaxID=205328 RepID=UPI001C0E3F9E|nr:helix-turn-helix domain-containing protein [Clostridium lacusfryxellense]MBU3110275.1 helix-turn-helix domain-containing protein [Clostridium lacusfryxellense]